MRQITRPPLVRRPARLPTPRPGRYVHRQEGALGWIFIVGSVALLAWWAFGRGGGGNGDTNGGGSGLANLQIQQNLGLIALATGSRGVDLVGPGEILNIDNTVQLVSIQFPGIVANVGTDPGTLLAEMEVWELQNNLPFRQWFLVEDDGTAPVNYPAARGLATYTAQAFPKVIQPGESFSFSDGFQIEGPATTNAAARNFWLEQDPAPLLMRVRLRQEISGGTDREVANEEWNPNAGDGLSIWYQDTIF